MPDTPLLPLEFMFTNGEGARLTTKNTNEGFRALRPILVPQDSERACFVVHWEESYTARDRFNVLGILLKSRRPLARAVRYSGEVRELELPPRDPGSQRAWVTRSLCMGDFKLEVHPDRFVAFPFTPQMCAEAQEVMLRKLANILEWPKRFPDGRVNSGKLFKSETFHLITTQRLKGF